MDKVFKYKSLNEFKKDNNSDYLYLYRNNLVNKLCDDMGWEKPITLRSWNIKEDVIVEAQKFQAIGQWSTKSRASLKSARKNGWMDECTAHMVLTRNPNGYFDTKEKCIEEAKKYIKISKWRIGCKASYNSAKINGWFDECTAHMVKMRIPHGYWTKERCKEEALKYNSKYEWRKGNQSSEATALKNGWTEYCTAHMTKLQIQKPSGYWNIERCKEDAKKYKQPSDWAQNSSGAVSYARKNNIFNECIEHMTYRETKPNGYWHSKENCLNSALKFTKQSDWIKAHGGAYNVAKENGWVEECTAHMKKN